MSELNQEIARRRTFGIISHPDAGKTTLTEKLLLFGERGLARVGVGNDPEGAPPCDLLIQLRHVGCGKVER